MMLENYKLKMQKNATKLHEMINHFKFVNDIKSFAKNQIKSEFLIQTVWILSQDIRIEFGIEILGEKEI